MDTSITSLVTGTLPRYVLGWLFPAMIVVIAGGVVVARVSNGTWVPSNVHHYSESTLLLGFLAISLVASYLLALLSATFYRLAMGAEFPKALQARLVRRQWYRQRAILDRWADLAHSAREGPLSATQRSEQAVLSEMLTHFPSQPGEFMPTRLGNQIKAIDDYGLRTFGLDVALFRDEMLALVPAQLRDGRRDALSVLDLLIALESVAGLLAVVSIAGAIARMDIELFYAAIVAIVAAAVCAHLTRDAVPRVLAADRAVVDAARRPLARSWGLDLPETFHLESQMWQALAMYVLRGDPSGLEGFRSNRRRNTMDG
jgi:hypothetical protein